MDMHEAALAHVSRAWDWFTGVVAVSATNLGIELGLFDALQRFGPMPPEELAQTLGLGTRAVDAWAKTLVQHGLLEVVDGAQVTLAPGAELVVCGPRTLYNLMPSFTYHARFLARDFLDLHDYFRDGVTRPPSRHGMALTRNIADQTSAMHSIFVSSMLPELPEIDVLLRMGASVLDAGCGTGDLGLALCSAYAGISYAGFDLDSDAIALGLQAIAEAGMGGRARLANGDVASAAPASFAIGLLFLALHEIDPQERERTVTSIRRALRPGGWLVLFDETCPESLTEAADSRARAALHLDYSEMLWGSRVPTRAETETLLRGAGFGQVERRPVLGGSAEIVLAKAD